jgi:hypothetical protein
MVEARQLLEEPLMESGDVDAREEVLDGHRSRLKRLSDRWLVSLLMVLVVITAGAIAAAVHYRADAATKRKAAAAAAAQVPAVAGFRPPNRPFSQSVTVASTRLPVGPGQHGLLAIIHSSTGATRPLIISVQLLHLHPGRNYSLIGNSCRSTAPDFVWATGRASKAGSLLLVTFPRDITLSDRYWLALRQPGGRVTSGVVGTFGTGDATPFFADQGPCPP